MTLNRWFAVPIVAAVTLAGSWPVRTPAVEVARVQAHLDSALVALSASTATDGLTPIQRVRREALIDTLRAYRDAGVFPHNYDFPGQLVPYFIDRKTGTLCAVGYLMAATGRRDLVDRVARSGNNVYVRGLAADTAFTGWLTVNGLTLADAEHIQVVYASQPPTAAVVAGATAFGVASLSIGGAVGTSVWNALGNRDGHRIAGTTLGVVTGLVSMGAGAMLLSLPGRAPLISHIGAGTMAVGGLSLGLAYRAMQHRRQLATPVPATTRSAMVDASVTPIVGVGRHAATGLSISLRY